MAPCDRSTFDQHWLEAGASTRSQKGYVHRCLKERNGVRSIISPHLAAAILEHHTTRKQIALFLKRLGHTQTAKKLDQDLTFPHNTMMGNFGEVVASEHIIQRLGYAMPVLKLRYRDGRLPMRGEDIVAFVLDDEGSIVRLCIGEAKAVADYRKKVVEDAHDRLAATYQPRPETLDLIARILYDQDRDDLAEKVDALFLDPSQGRIDQENWIFLITGNAQQNPFDCLPDASLVPNLHCVDLHLEDLASWVKDLFTPSKYPEVISGA